MRQRTISVIPHSKISSESNEISNEILTWLVQLLIFTIRFRKFKSRSRKIEFVIKAVWQDYARGCRKNDLPPNFKSYIHSLFPTSFAAKHLMLPKSWMLVGLKVMRLLKPALAIASFILLWLKEVSLVSCHEYFTWFGFEFLMRHSIVTVWLMPVKNWWFGGSLQIGET